MNFGFLMSMSIDFAMLPIMTIPTPPKTVIASPMLKNPARKRTKHETRVEGIITKQYIKNLTVICFVNETGIIFEWKKFSPSLVTLLAAKDEPTLKNIIKIKTAIPGSTPVPSFETPMFVAIELEP